MCRFCEKYVKYGNYDVDVDCLSTREPSKYDSDLYTGIESYIDFYINGFVLLSPTARSAAESWTVNNGKRT